MNSHITTPAELRAMTKAGRSKYRNKKTTLDGLTFDSKKEASYYGQLIQRQAAGEITGFDIQPEFVLIAKQRLPSGVTLPAVKYRADFRVKYPCGRTEIVDVKGVKTAVYVIKKKLMWLMYQIEIVEV